MFVDRGELQVLKIVIVTAADVLRRHEALAIGGPEHIALATQEARGFRSSDLLAVDVL